MRFERADVYFRSCRRIVAASGRVALPEEAERSVELIAVPTVIRDVVFGVLTGFLTLPARSCRRIRAPEAVGP